MENHIGELVDAYFPHNPEVFEDLKTITFASQKKLKQLFAKSTSFVEASVSLLNDSLLQDHREEFMQFLKRLHSIYSSLQVKDDPSRVFREKGIKNPWMPSEAREVYQLVGSFFYK